MREREGWVAHTHEVTHFIDAELSLLKDAETGQRGYLLVGNDSYLQPYERALEGLDANLQHLRELTRDNAEQQTRWNTLEPLVQTKLAVLKEAIDLRRRDGFEAALAVVRTDKGKEVMDRIRVVLAEARAAEEALLVIRDREAQAAHESLRLVVTVGIALALLILVALGLAITRAITTPLGAAVKMIEKMSRGELETRLHMETGDEVGMMATAMDKLADSVESVVVEIAELNDAASEGRLTQRADPSSHLGDFRKIVRGTNDTLDAVIEPLNKVAAILNRIANDDIPRPIDEVYEGDFDALKTNLNKMIESLRNQYEELQSGFGVLAASSTAARAAPPSTRPSKRRGRATTGGGSPSWRRR